MIFDSHQNSTSGKKQYVKSIKKQYEPISKNQVHSTAWIPCHSSHGGLPHHNGRPWAHDLSLRSLLTGRIEFQKERKERIKNNFFICCILTCVKPNKSKNARRPETHHHVQHPATSCNIVQHCRCRFLNLSQLQVRCSDFFLFRFQGML